MRPNLFACVGMALAALSASAASAQTAYKAEDIVKHFTAAPPIGATRGLCVGTEAECNKGAIAKPADAFDLVLTFDLNSDVLTTEARRNLDEFAAALKDPSLASRSFAVDGHTDASGTANYNLSLSERRANAVVEYLATKGIDKSKLLAKGYGPTKPRNPADPFDPTNRRVETRIQTN